MRNSHGIIPDISTGRRVVGTSRVRRHKEREMNVWQCTACGSTLWQLSGFSAVCAKCGRVPPSVRIVFVPVEPAAQTIEKVEAKS